MLCSAVNEPLPEIDTPRSGIVWLPSESPSCVSSPRLRIVSFKPLKACPLTFYIKVAVSYSDLSLEFLQQGCGQLFRSVPWLRTTRMRSVKNCTLGIETARLGIVWFLSKPPSRVGTPRSNIMVRQLHPPLPHGRGRGQVQTVHLG